MAEIIISKIQLRKGSELDLPGAPTNIDPIEFSDGLDVAELAFTSDSGRLFIGHDPEQGQPNFERNVFPYQNIEVLTENSQQTLQNMVNVFNRKTTQDSFYVTDLSISSDPENGYINVAYNGAITIFEDADRVSVMIEYFITTMSGLPFRHGKLSIMHDGSTNEPQIHDDYNDFRSMDGDIDDGVLYADEIYGHSFRFRSQYDTNSSTPYVTFEYLNNSGEPLKMAYRITHVIL